MAGLFKSKVSIDFDPIFHTYTDRDTGKSVPSVTTLLQRAGYINARFYKGTEGRDDGTEVHELTRRADSGLPVTGSNERISLCMAQYSRFLAECSAQRVRAECIVHSKSLGYCGTMDGEWKIGIEPFNGATLLGDIKTGVTVPSWCKLQTAAYDIADGGMIIRPTRMRFALHLTPETYKIKTYSDDGDYLVWMEIARKFANV